MVLHFLSCSLKRSSFNHLLAGFVGSGREKQEYDRTTVLIIQMRDGSDCEQGRDEFDAAGYNIGNNLSLSVAGLSASGTWQTPGSGCLGLVAINFSVVMKGAICIVSMLKI